MKLIKKLFVLAHLLPCLWLPVSSSANEAAYPLDHVPVRTDDLVALQNGAKLFVNYCLNCHSAALMRYNRLKDIGLTEEQIKNNLLFTGEKVGDMMKTSLAAQDAKTWFGTVPPDLSVIVRARSSLQGSGADYIYTYLRTFYQDDTRPTGWNNLVLPNVAMPHALWDLQGIQRAQFIEQKDPHEAGKTVHQFAGFEQIKPGKLKPNEYNDAVADLVAFMDWMAEPVQNTRKRIGVLAMFVLTLFAVLAWRLNAAYWKHIR